MCRSLAIGRLLLELAAPAFEDDFVGLLGDPIIQQAGDGLHEVPRRFGNEQVIDPGMHQPLAFLIRHRQQLFQPFIHRLVLARGPQHGDKGIDLGDAFHSASLDDDVALARHALPFLVIGAHVGDELRLAHVHHVHAHAAIALAHRFDGKCFAQGRAQFVDDAPRNTSRRKNSGKGARLIAFDADFIQGRHAGQQRRAPERGDGECLDTPFPDMDDGRGELVHHRLDLAAQQVGKRRAAAFVRHMQQLQVGLPHQQLDRQMVRRAVAGGSDAHLSGFCFYEGEEFLEGRGQRLRCHRQHDRHGLDRPDCHQVPERVVGKVPEHGRPGGHRAAGAEGQRVAGGGGPHYRRGADGAAGAGAVLDDHLLAERFGERRREGAGGDVDVAAPGPRHHDAQRAGGEVLCEPCYPKDPDAKQRQDAFQDAGTPLPAGRMKGYIDCMSKAKVADLKKHYPDLAPDKDYPPLKFKSLTGRVSAAEWEARVDCACAYRLVRHYDMHDLIYNHISARIPGTEEFLLNPFGLLYEEMCASSLIKVDLEGKVLWEPDWPQGLNYTFNLAGFVIHGAIHAAKPDIHCVIHTHSLAGMAVASLKKGVLPMTQTAMRFSRVAYADYEGVVLEMDERKRLLENLGDCEVMLLRNHGTLAVGKTVGEAFNNMYRLERAR